jgi:hypothetical protein
MYSFAPTYRPFTIVQDERPDRCGKQQPCRSYENAGDQFCPHLALYVRVNR